MFDFAWSELALIAAVALIVIGPKDLPRVLRTVGQYVRKARSIAREFQSSVEDMVRDAGLDDVKQHVEQATRFNFEEEFAKTVDPQGELQRSLSEPSLTNPLTDPPKIAPPNVSSPSLPAPSPALPGEAVNAAPEAKPAGPDPVSSREPG